jgi:hypothetical protein
MCVKEHFYVPVQTSNSIFETSRAVEPNLLKAVGANAA